MKRTTGTQPPRGNQGGHPPKKRRLKTLEDLRRYLADAIHRLEAGEIDDPAATTRAYLVNILAGVVKDSDIEARLVALEAAQALASTTKPKRS